MSLLRKYFFVRQWRVIVFASSLLLIFLYKIKSTNNLKWTQENTNTNANGMNGVSSDVVNNFEIPKQEMKSDRNKTCINMVKTDCYPELRSWLEKLVQRQAPADDEELIRLARHLIEPPSNHVVRKLPWGPRSTPQAEYVNNLLKDKRSGFFIEAGAQDGERASNTVWLEVERDWTGLLVEIDPWFYTQMRGKLRHAHIINACLSPTSTVTQLFLEESSGGLGKVVDEKDLKNVQKAIKIPCFPVETLLLAINQTTVDYFSLDVEGLEYSVIQTIPFDKFDIKTWSIEYSHTNSTGVKSYMSEKGYKFMKQLNVYDQKMSLVVEDYIFQKSDK